MQNNHRPTGTSGGEQALKDVSPESRLLESDVRFRSLCESMMDAFVSVDMSGRLLEFNSAYRELLGYTEEELHRLTYVDLTPAKWHALEAKIVAEQVIPLGYSEIYEKEYIRKDGKLVPIELRTSLVRSAAGEPLLMWAIIRDISARKRIEEALLEREQRLSFYLDNSPMASIEWDAGFRVTHWSREAEKIFGWTAAETVGKLIWDLQLIYEQDVPQVEQVVRDLFGASDDKYVYSANRNYTRDGRTICCEWYNTILRNPQGETVSILSQVMDVTERKQTETEREQFYQFFTASPDLLCLAGANGYFLKVNPAFTSVLGYTEQELLSRPLIDFVHPDDRQATLEMMEQTTSGQLILNDFHNRYRCRDGSYRWLSWNAHFQVEEQIYFGLARDITEQKRLGEALQQSEQRYRAIVESQTGHVSRFLPGGILTYVNPALAKWYGAKPEELIGRSFFPFLHEHEREEIIGKIESLTCESPPVTMEVSILSRHGELHWLQWTNHAICDAQGHIVEYQGVGHDITEKKEAELYLARAREKLEQQVRERTEALTLVNEQLRREIEERRCVEQDLRNYQRQLEAMSLEVSLATDRERARIAGELHDDVGQRLILSRIKLDKLATQCSEPEQGQSLQELQQFIDQIINDIRSLTFQLRPPILAHAGLLAAVEWLGEELKQNFSLAIKVRHDACPIDFPYETKSTIFQVVRELLLNVAKHAGTDHAVVSFKTVAGALNIIVDDDGVGFDVEKVLAGQQRPKSFGLFNIRQRIGHLGGRLEFQSTPGQGSRATIIIPTSDGHAPPHKAIP